MMSVEIDPSERRSPAPARSGWRGPALIAAAGLGGVAAFGAFAYPAVSALLAPRPSAIRVGPIREMPEIKDGIPALKADTPEIAPEAPRVRTVAIPPAAAPTEKPAEPPQTPPPAQPVVAARADSLVTGTLNPPQRFEHPAPEPVAKAVEPQPSVSEPAEPKPVEPKVTEPKATESKPVEPKSAAPAPNAEPAPAAREARETAPVPAKPPAKAAAKPQKPAPKPVAKREKPDATRTATAEPAPAPEQPERNTFLGLPVPDFAPAGKAIKDTVEAVGDAVINFPKRL
ncbi:hypothetical protein [Methylobacterium nodulans]|uniref:Putative CheA signal transduction histidine kinase n=1 Tax=Methylobacterium nodulans (strain LMG 21967 / CNCM I-2342 / ORS 2060) TaxID=460265 RepID=B8IL76_METNO|nr:hypothetical protein [Methylobacterium nodulans]ACL58264.1 putative CheA signal transduction histidine kinase [Methylobacterium nodulans ORS 2060]